MMQSILTAQRHERQIRCGLVCAALLAAGGLQGCSMGRTKLTQTYYLAVPSDENINYYRIRVQASTVLGETSFRSGWFPSDAIDNLYGDAGKSGISEAYRVQEDLKAKYNAAILHTTSGYLAAAQDPKSDPDTVQSWLTAQRRVRAAAGDATPLPSGAIEMEYDPGRGLTTRHAGEKLVLVLASDPDAIIGTISAYSKDVQTGATVMRFADVLRQQSLNEVEVTEARNATSTRSNALLVQSMDALTEVLKSNPNRDQLAREIEALRLQVENAR